MNLTASTRWVRPHLGWFLLAALLVSAGCQQMGCEPSTTFGPTGDIPDSAQERRQQLAGQVPAAAQVSALIDDTAAVRDTIEQARSNAGGPLPVLDELEANFQKRTGIDLFKADSWNKAGLAADGGAGLTSMTGRPVMFVYVTDQKKFEDHFTTQAQSTLDIEGKPETKKVGDTQIKMMGDEKHQRVAWGYAGRLAVITIPPNEGATEEGTPTASSALETILTLDAGKSMRETTGFQKFSDAVSAEHNFMIYADSDAAIDEGILSGAAERFASASGNKTAELKRRFDGVGLVFSLDGRRVGGRMWIGMNDETAADINAMYADGPEVDWSNLGTENTLLSARLATQWSEFWQNYLGGLSDSRRRNLENQIKRIGEAVGINAQKDLIDNLTGQMALFVYGVTPNFNVSQISSNPLGSIDQIGAILAAQVDNADLLRNTLQTVTSKVGSFVELSTVGDADVGASDAVHVISFKKPDDSSGIAAMLMKNPPPLRIYAYKNQLAIATNAIDRKPMSKYLKGERSEQALTDIDELDLGGKFVTDNQMTGLYINFIRIQNHLMKKLPPVPQLRSSLESVQEVMLNFAPQENGAFVDLTVDVSDKAMGGSGADSSGDNKADSDDTPDQNN